MIFHVSYRQVIHLYQLITGHFKKIGKYITNIYVVYVLSYKKAEMREDLPSCLKKVVIKRSAFGSAGKPLEWCCQTPQVDCYAPGQVWSKRVDGIDTINGSSLATVLAAGVAALWLAREQRL